MHSTVAANVQTPSQRARNQSARSAHSRVALRKANREVVDVRGAKSMILVCIFSPLKSSVSLAVHGVAGKSCRKRGARSYFGRARLPNGRYAQPALGNDSMSQTTLDREMRRAAGPRRSTSTSCGSAVCRRFQLWRAWIHGSARFSVQSRAWSQLTFRRWLYLSIIREPRPTRFNLTSQPARNTLATRAW
jgi:hypothetical protein